MVDFGYAERIAWLASKHGWDYWLDVHDPGLAVINSLTLSPKSQALADALIIEVALLNCTHVIATITDNSPGAAWIPNEYGRVKPKSVSSQLASCWLHPLHAITPAEYMNLGPILGNEWAIRHWLSTENTILTIAKGLKVNTTVGIRILQSNCRNERTVRSQFQRKQPVTRCSATFRTSLVLIIFLANC
jgi:hypothetical protein